MLDARQQRARFGVLCRGQEAAQELDRVPVAVLAHERDSARPRAPSASLGDSASSARPACSAAGQSLVTSSSPSSIRSGRGLSGADRDGPMEQRGRGVEAPRGLGARGGREQHALEQVARLGRVARVERLGVAHVLGGRGHLGVEARDEPRRRRQVGRRRRIARGRLGHERRRAVLPGLPQGDRLGQCGRAGGWRGVAGRALAGRTHRRGFATRLAQMHDGRADQQRESERGQKQAAPGGRRGGRGGQRTLGPGPDGAGLRDHHATGGAVGCRDVAGAAARTVHVLAGATLAVPPRLY